MYKTANAKEDASDASKQQNTTGIPDADKSRYEDISGLSLDGSGLQGRDKWQ